MDDTLDEDEGMNMDMPDNMDNASDNNMADNSSDNNIMADNINTSNYNINNNNNGNNNMPSTNVSSRRASSVIVPEEYQEEYGHQGGLPLSLERMSAVTGSELDRISCVDDSLPSPAGATSRRVSSAHLRESRDGIELTGSRKGSRVEEGLIADPFEINYDDE